MFKYMWKEIFGESKTDRLFMQLMDYIGAIQEDYDEQIAELREEINTVARGSAEFSSAIALATKVKPKAVAKMIATNQVEDFIGDTYMELSIILQKIEEEEMDEDDERFPAF